MPWNRHDDVDLSPLLVLFFYWKWVGRASGSLLKQLPTLADLIGSFGGIFSRFRKVRGTKKTRPGSFHRNDDCFSCCCCCSTQMIHRRYKIPGSQQDETAAAAAAASGRCSLHLVSSRLFLPVPFVPFLFCFFLSFSLLFFFLLSFLGFGSFSFSFLIFPYGLRQPSSPALLSPRRWSRAHTCVSVPPPPPPFAPPFVGRFCLLRFET